MEENQELQTQDSSPEIEETKQTTSQNEAQASSANEENIRQLRESRKKAERERDEYLQRLKQMEELQKQAQQSPQRDPSDLAEMRDIEEANKRTAAELAKTRAEIQELRLKTQYPDIEQTLSPANIEKLKETDPDLAQIISEMPDDNRKAIAAYKYIKKMGLDSTKSYDQEKEQIAANQSKPKSSAATGGKQTPLSEMNNFIQDPAEYRKKLYKEMVAAAENR